METKILTEDNEKIVEGTVIIDASDAPIEEVSSVCECGEHVEVVEGSDVLEKSEALGKAFVTGFGDWVVRGQSKLTVAKKNYGSPSGHWQAGKRCYGSRLIRATYWNGKVMYYQPPVNLCKSGGSWC